MSTFAITGFYHRSLQSLRTNHFIVLDGPPEVGKSTIAASLALYFLTEDYEIVDLRNSQGFFECYARESKQLFIADDVVGSTSFDPTLSDGWSRELPGILRCIGPEHLLIWTARKYILEKALQATKLKECVDGFPSLQEVLIEVSGYTPKEKVMMIYNHAKNARMSDLMRKAIKAVAKTLIESPNFTPERVRQLFGSQLEKITTECQEVGKIQTEIIDFFKDPSRRWEIAFDKLDPCEKELLFALFDLCSKADKDALEHQYNRRICNISYPISFKDCLSRLEYSFLKTTKTYFSKIEVDFQHPSLRDMLLLSLKNIPSARMEHIRLMSLRGVIGTLNTYSNGDREHDFVLEHENEIIAFSERIIVILGTSISSREWNSVLKTTIAGINQIPTKIVISILKASTNPEIIDINSWDLEEWCDFLDLLYYLLSLQEHSPRPLYVERLADRFKTSDYKPGLSFLYFLSRWEPIIYKREVWSKKHQEWLEDLEEEIHCSISLSEDHIENPSNDNEDVISQIDETIGFIDTLKEGHLIPDSLDYLIKELEDLVEKIPVMEEQNDEEYEHLTDHYGSEYWTIDRIINDI